MVLCKGSPSKQIKYKSKHGIKEELGNTVIMDHSQGSFFPQYAPFDELPEKLQHNLKYLAKTDFFRQGGSTNDNLGWIRSVSNHF